MISDDRLHKTRFFKKGRLTKTLLIIMGGGWSKRGGLEQFRILKGGGQKEGGVTFLRGVDRGGGSYPGAHYAMTQSQRSTVGRFY